jgi:chaperone required for assembly of F1-ATPase
MAQDPGETPSRPAGTVSAPALQAPVLPKRFYQSVTVSDEPDGQFGIRLDGKLTRTPARNLLLAPRRPLADAMAQEWAAQTERIDPSSMPYTRLVVTALDGVAGQEAAVISDLLGYARSDLLCYRIGHPVGHAQLQSEHWDPVLRWARDEHGLQFALATEITFVEQPEATLQRMAALLGPVTALDLAALHTMTTLSGSAILMLAVKERAITPEMAWAAASVDEDWQIKLWGLVDEAAVRRERRTRDFLAAGQVLKWLSHAS